MKFRPFILLLCIGVLFTFLSEVSYAQSCTHHLNASDGSDSNPGTLTSPVRSFEFAFKAFPSGSKVCVASGDYFYGDDSDGVQLKIEKSMDFIINTFAGTDEVRFSEREFTVDIRGGVVRFLPGSTTHLSFGIGIVNLDLAGGPNLLNYLHTIEVRSGTLDFSTVDVEIGTSVGNPLFNHPSNSNKNPPASAAIIVGNGYLIGTPSWQAGPRTFRFRGDVDDAVFSQLPHSNTGSSIYFENSNSLSINQVLNLAGSRVFFNQSGSVRFSQDVIFGSSSSNFTFSNENQGLTVFEGAFSVQIEQENSSTSLGGVGSIKFSSITIENPPTVGSFELTISDQPQVTISRLGLESTQSTTSFAFNTVNDSGTLLLGDPMVPLEMPGRLSNNSNVTLLGDFVATGNVLLGIENNGLIELGSNRIIFNHENSHIRNNGIINSDGDNAFQFKTSGTISGNGSYSGIWEVSGEFSISDIPTVDAVLLDNGILALENGSFLTVSSTVDVLSGGELILKDDSALRVDSISISGDQSHISLNDSATLFLKSSLQVKNQSYGFLSTTGAISIEGSGFNLSGLVEGSLPEVSTNGHSGTISGFQKIGGVRSSGGSVVVQSVADNLIIDNLIASNTANIDVFVPGMVQIIDTLSVNDAPASITLSSPSPIDLGMLVFLDNGTLSFPGSGARISRSTSISSPEHTTIVLPKLHIEDQQAFLSISGNVLIQEDFEFANGTILLNEEGTLALEGDLRRIAGVFALESEGQLLMIGHSNQEISGFVGSVLPSISSSSPNLLISESLTLFGSLKILEGEVNVDSGSTITLESDLMINGGNLMLTQTSSIWVGGHFTISSGQLYLESGILTFEGNISITGGEIVNGILSAWRVTNSEHRFLVIDSPVSIPNLELTTNSILNLGGSIDPVVSSMLAIREGALLNLGNRSIVHTSINSSSSVVNDGRFTGASGFLKLLSSSGSFNPTIAGSGTFGNIEIVLNSDLSAVKVVGTSPSISFAEILRLTSGKLDLNGHSFNIANFTSVPHLQFNLEDRIGQAGQPDGSEIVDGLQNLKFNLEEKPFDLSFYGPLTTLFEPKPIFLSNGLRNLSISARDEVNSPSVFGIRIVDHVTMAGNLFVERGSLLRLPNALTLSGNNGHHLVNGQISGVGKVIVQGNGSSINSEFPEASLSWLEVIGQSEDDHFSIDLVGSVGLLEIGNGNVSIGSLIAGSTDIFRVSSQLIVSGGTVQLEIPVEVGRGFPSPKIKIAGSLQYLPGSFLHLPSGGSLNITASASLNLVNLSPWNFQGNEGFIVLGSETILESFAPIPRLMLASIKGQTTSDDVFVTSELVITDVLSIVDGDLHLSSHNLIFTGKQIAIDSNGSPFDGPFDNILGDSAGEKGAFLISSAAEVRLGGNAELHSLKVVVNVPNNETVQITSSNLVSKQLTLVGRSLELQSGTLDLGLNDIIIHSSAIGALTASGGKIKSTSRFSLGLESPVLPFGPSSDLRPFLDDEYGELVLIGSGNASIELSSTLNVNHVRISGTIRLNGGVNPLIVTDRFVFGREGASLLSTNAGLVQIGNDAQVLRRGNGTLSHRPTFDGPVNLFYELDDGSVTGNNSNIDALAVGMGLELPPNGIINSISVLAGNGPTNTNSVFMTEPITVLNHFSIYSGKFSSLGNSLTLEGSATLSINDLDANAVLLLSIGNDLSTNGLIDLDIKQRHERINITSELLGNVRQFRNVNFEMIHLGSSTADALRLGISLEAEKMAIRSSGVQRALNLGGFSLTASDSLIIENSVVKSSQTASLISDNTFEILEGSSIEGNISISSEGRIRILGAFRGLMIDSKGDIVFKGEISPSTSLKLSGEYQSLDFDKNVQIAQLLMEMTGESPKAEVAFSHPVELSILSSLNLSSGILNMMGSTLKLGGNPGYSRSLSGTSPSHVIGTVVRNASEGSTIAYEFPIGTSSGFYPMVIEFTTPLLSKTTLSASVSEHSLISSSGLPILSGSNYVNTVTSPIWKLSSSVNFGRSQPFTLVTTIPVNTANSIDFPKLLARDWGNGHDPWMLVPGTQISSITNKGLILRSFGATGNLKPSGVEIAVGVFSPTINSLFHTQIVNLSTDSEIKSPSLILNSSSIVRLTESEFATPVVPVHFSSSELIISGLLNESDQTIDTKEVLATSGTHILGLFSNKLDSSIQGELISWTNETSVPTNKIGITFINSLSNEFSLDVKVSSTLESSKTFNSRFQEEPNYIELLENEDIFEFFDADTKQPIETFQFPLGNFLGQNILAIAHSKAGNIHLSIVDSFGQISESSKVTGVSRSPSEVPNQISLFGNYPNPFNPSTRINFSLPQSSEVQIKIFDVLGREVSIIRPGLLNTGSIHSIEFDAGHLASGMYIYVVSAKTGSLVKEVSGKMVLMR